MSIDLTTLTPRELQIYAAGYTDAANANRAAMAQADEYLAQDAAELTALTAQLARANSDADRYYRAAFNPRPPIPIGIPYAELEKQRAALYESRAHVSRVA
ncbi:hypothetical protein [Agreia sp. COWG]|uniref:hypothetical protein n=1 Tax=Agreia sp. COWG TaxID=2773266 RepID=UPI00192834BD|nr:hypothetical protein [Agreia sp. COWG]CAD6016168.1 conserved protein of unknown function [Agreia sp. COWG]